MQNDIQQPDFSKLDGLLPAIVQDATTGQVLMLGFMNEEAYTKTVQEHRVTFFSRTKNRLWTKGESSGHFLDVVAMHLDCDQDTVLIQAHPNGAVCHTGEATCFSPAHLPGLIGTLEAIIAQRQQQPSDASYTSSLFARGINKIAQKVGEEAVELVIEAKDSNDDLFLNEAADLLFHYLILLKAKGFGMGDVLGVLQARNAKK